MRLFTKGLGFVMTAALFIVTISCTIDLLGQILPAKYWYLPALGTAAFDIGVIAWFLTLLHDVENSEQLTIAWILLGLDFLGVATTVIADVFFFDASKGLVAALPADWTRGIIVALMIIILANVGAWMGMHITHPKHIARTTGRALASSQTRVVESTTESGALPRPKQGLIEGAKTLLFGEQQQSPILPVPQSNPEQTFTLEQMQQALSQAYDEGAHSASPLAQAPLETNNSQTGPNGRSH